ncbi:uncharacterized protein LOC110463338 isoform X2 [Mizuhopecten yessoensis]|uniref:uncharacterized protein LOC110463338 isoform X2 n=1 Tax=Mizuhopecten yessoensis TaxID=6573 RepID=UPI000B45AF45|nr:uncharacterized protein LOC110463338 isoform X2 [Mizuhopecten yessoensis]
MTAITRYHMLCICLSVVTCFCIPMIFMYDLELHHFLRMIPHDAGSEDVTTTGKMSSNGDNTTIHSNTVNAREVLDYKTNVLGIRKTGQVGYMVYDCSNAHHGECGGWSDRLSGMLSVYVIALVTNQTFLVHHDNPCPLQDYLDYKGHNWVFNQARMEAKQLSHQYLPFYCKVPVAIRSNRLDRLFVTFHKEINFVRMNWDYTEHFRASKGIGKTVPWITTLQYSDIYKHFFNSLFVLKKELNDNLDSIKRQKQFACAHIRMGESGTVRTTLPQLVDIWRFLKQKERQKFSIFVATDSNSVRKKANKLFPRSIVDIDGIITHIDITKKGDLCAGFRKAMLDFFMLTRCEALLITRSGFGILAAYLREQHKLHCLTPNGVVSCTRFTIHDIYPTPILSPF